MIIKTFYVWQDTALNEVLAIEKENMTPQLEKQLLKENIHIHSIEAENLHEANVLFLEKMEQSSPYQSLTLH